MIILCTEINEIFITCSWSEFAMPMQKLCSGDWDRTLQFSVFDWNRSASLFHCLKLYSFIIYTQTVYIQVLYSTVFNRTKY